MNIFFGVYVYNVHMCLSSFFSPLEIGFGVEFWP